MFNMFNHSNIFTYFFLNSLDVISPCQIFTYNNVTSSPARPAASAGERLLFSLSMVLTSREDCWSTDRISLPGARSVESSLDAEAPMWSGFAGVRWVFRGIKPLTEGKFVCLYTSRFWCRPPALLVSQWVQHKRVDDKASRRIVYWCKLHINDSRAN